MLVDPAIVWLTQPVTCKVFPRGAKNGQTIWPVTSACRSFAFRCTRSDFTGGHHVHIKKFFANYCMGVTPGLITARIAMNAGTPESMIVAIDMVRAEDGKVHIDVKGRWLAAQCKKTR